MNISEAIKKRILNICDEKEISINKLVIMSGLTQSTLQSIISGKSQNPKMLTIVRICESLEIDIQEFFNDPIFKNIDSQL